MTVYDIIKKRGKAFKKGDYEFVEGPDGLGHLLIVTMTGERTIDGLPYLTFFCPCGILADGDVNGFVIAKDMTCLTCMSR